jgi:hypothetical protein
VFVRLRGAPQCVRRAGRDIATRNIGAHTGDLSGGAPCACPTLRRSKRRDEHCRNDCCQRRHAHGDRHRLRPRLRAVGAVRDEHPDQFGRQCHRHHPGWPRACVGISTVDTVNAVLTPGLHTLEFDAVSRYIRAIVTSTGGTAVASASIVAKPRMVTD